MIDILKIKYQEKRGKCSHILYWALVVIHYVSQLVGIVLFSIFSSIIILDTCLTFNYTVLLLFEIRFQLLIFGMKIRFWVCIVKLSMCLFILFWSHLFKRWLNFSVHSQQIKTRVKSTSHFLSIDMPHKKIWT